MRVLHLASGREWRGGQRQTLLLTQGLGGRADLAQTLVTARGGELATRVDTSAVRLRGISWHVGLDPRAFVTAWGEARAADLIHAHDAHAVAVGAVASARTGRPLVVTRRMARPLRRPGLWRRAARVIAISGAVRDQLQADGIDPERIIVVPPAIDLEATARTVPFDWTDAIPWVPGTPVAVAVAALTPEKGLDQLVEAAALLAGRHPALQWVIAGAGPERSRLSMLIGARSASGYVHLLGYMVDPLPVIAAATVLVMPSREEGFGTTILDALALGTPVVATSVGGMPEALAHGGGVLVAPGDPAGLAEAVARFVREPEWRDRLSGEARLAARRSGLAPMVEEVVGVYRSCIQELIGAQ